MKGKKNEEKPDECKNQDSGRGNYSSSVYDSACKYRIGESSL